MNPRAKKYRIRRSPVTGVQVQEGPGSGSGGEAPVAANTGTPAGVTAGPNGPQTTSVEQEISAIRSENLTGRQLRLARRTAQKHGLSPASDLDAVRLLRRAGIDPFQRSNMLELVTPERPEGESADLPATKQITPPGPQQLPDPDSRAREIRRIQHDIAHRRRVRMALLAARLMFFVMLPTMLAGYYYYRVATPMYSTTAEFVIQQADTATGPSLGRLFSGTGFATSQDSIAVQRYLTSRDAMLRLDQDLGFKAHFSQPGIDPIQRLSPDASNEDAYKLYKRHIKIGYDPTEGIVKMEVIAADPRTARAFAEALISYAEERVDKLTQRLREDQMQGARQSYAEAERKMLSAQERVLALQKRRGVLSADLEVSAQMSQISTFEIELQNERLRLQQMLANAQPNETRVAVAQGNIQRLEDLLEKMRASLTQEGDNSASLATISGELIVAQADLETRKLLLAQSLQQLESARIEANRQVRFLSLGVQPVEPDAPAYPRAFENSVLAFLIFAGLYLMASLTASILREQVSA